MVRRRTGRSCLPARDGHRSAALTDRRAPELGPRARNGTGAAAARTIEGCWTLNGRAARFAQRGARVAGALTIGTLPLFLDGGSDGRIVRFVWIRGNDYGLALASVAPDGKHLTAVEWHERPSRCSAQSVVWHPCSLQRSCTSRGCRARAHAAGGAVLRVRICGSAHDDTLDTEASRETLDVLAVLLERGPARIVVHEFREATPEKNKARAERIVASVRAALGAGVEVLAAGSDAPRQQPVTETQRAMYSCVDLEIRR